MPASQRTEHKKNRFVRSARPNPYSLKLLSHYMFRLFDHHQAYNTKTQYKAKAWDFCKISQNNVL
jgi:hypothetical protein